MTTMVRKLTSVRGRHRSGREEGDATREQKSEHVSVLLREALEALSLKKGDVVIDATAGLGGHSAAMLAVAPITLLAIDADPDAAALSQKRLGKKARVVEGNFADLQKILKKSSVPKADKVLFDLGWNSSQLLSGRGLSFLRDEPLDMSFSPEPRSGFKAAEILNTWSEKAIADVLFGYGEERYAKRIARAVVERRKTSPLTSTLEFVEIIRDSVPASYRHGRIHPATRSFQALRIAVNDELGALTKGLQGAWGILAPGGRIAVITFHSIEDRIVKRYFVSLSQKKEGKLLFKKPLAPSVTEVAANPSARSAKLRAIEKYA